MRIIGGLADGRLDDPAGIAGDGAGRVYVADVSNHRILMFAPDFPVLVRPAPGD